MKCWHPDVFCASLLNAQPMGFYAPAQIVRDAREHGVEVRPVCVNASRWDRTLEPIDDERFAVRLGLRMVRGLANKDGGSIVASRADAPFESIDDLWRRARVPSASLVELADADAMRESLGLARREALWAIKALRDEPLALFAAAAKREARTVAEADEPDVTPRPMTCGEEVVEDYRHVGLSLRRHPVEFLRADFAARRVVTCADAMAARDGRWLQAAGIVLVRQRPGSAKGVMIITIEDETGIANLVVWPSLFEKQRRVVLSAGMLSVRGRIQREGEVVHLVAQHLSGRPRQRRRSGRRVSLTARPRRSDPGRRQFRVRPTGSTATGAPDARYLYPGPSHRFYQSEDAGLPVGTRKPHLAPCFREVCDDGPSSGFCGYYIAKGQIQRVTAEYLLKSVVARCRRGNFSKKILSIGEALHPDVSDCPAMAVHFSVDTKLTRLLGETYRSSEVALKELVDNAWDADARSVRIVLPDPLSSESIVVHDDGSGMTSRELRGEYLNIASDKRSRIGKETPGLNRKVKGRKGIGKFAGLMIAHKMQIESVARGKKCTLIIDKKELIENESDLESVPLSLEEAEAEQGFIGTKVTLSLLDSSLNFPVPDRLREVLIYEYGREDSFKVYVNGVPLSVQDVPGTASQLSATLPTAGNVDLRFTIAEGKKLPRSPGIILKVGGKAVGKPQLFGLDEDEEIPQKLARKVYGEVEIAGMEDYVTADWGGIIENSKAYQEAEQLIRAEVKRQLQATHAKAMGLQKARLQRQIDARLQKLPENRRRFAEQAVHRILKRFYGETIERIETIVDVALDAMEHDAYWEVLERINEARETDIGSFAEALEQFGLLELSTIGTRAAHRRTFLDFLDQLVQNAATHEKDAHKAFENNLWMLGRKYSMMSSNATLKSVIGTYCDSTFKGNRASKRPDLLLSQDYGDSYLLHPAVKSLPLRHFKMASRSPVK